MPKTFEQTDQRHGRRPTYPRAVPVSASPSEIRAGSLIGGYRIESLIASGGMGLVYDAYELACERRVALKVIAPEFANDSQFRHRFVDEARIAMRLEHPHVVPVHAAGMVDGVLFMVMRKIDGVDLGALIARARGLDAARAIALVDQVASGLDAAHSLGLVHRDIKPANIMVQKLDFAREHAYIMDFGLAKQAGSRGVTRPDDLLGTLDYIAPEQIVGGRVDARTDVYALGASLFHALSGHAPFAGDHHAAKIFAHLTARPPKITDSRPDLPETFDSVLARAMAKNPADRFSSAGALARSLCEAQNDTCWRYWARA